MEAYLGNPNLKRVNVPQEFSEENIIEYNKCSKDPLYFIENFVRIVSLDHGLVPFDMYDFQRDMVNSMHNNRFTIHKLPRQSGKSTIIISYLLHFRRVRRLCSLSLNVQYKCRKTRGPVR